MEPEPEEPLEPVEEEPAELPRRAAPTRPSPARWIDAPSEWEEAPRASEPPAPMQVPEPAGRIRVESRPHPEEQNVFNAQTELEPPTTTMESLQPQASLREPLEERPRERRTADRVAYLFPRPDTTEWDVRELSYDRRRRARVRAS